jgi:hypothetical protein
MTKFQPAQYLPHAPKTSIELTIAPTQCPTQAYILFDVQCLSNPWRMKNLECERRISTLPHELNLIRIKGPEDLEGQSNIWVLLLTDLS